MPIMPGRWRSKKGRALEDARGASQIAWPANALVTDAVRCMRLDCLAAELTHKVMILFSVEVFY